MTLGIMQPYFFPYIGYFQLINAVDKFVIYDNIEFTKKGWINRNRFLQNGKDQLFSLPIKKDSDFLDVNQRFLSDSFDTEKEKIKRQIHSAYKKAPYFDNVYPLFEQCMNLPDKNLFNFISHSLQRIMEFLSINTELVASSQISEGLRPKGQEGVIFICQKLGADRYINPIGGKELYSKEEFQREGIELFFIESQPIAYNQLNNGFVPKLSILDVMMFNSPNEITKILKKYELL